MTVSITNARMRAASACNNFDSYRCCLSIAVTAILAGSMANPALAAPINWLNAADGVFTDGVNWDGGTPPTATDGAIYNTGGGAYTVTFTGNDNSAAAVVKDNAVTWDLGSNTYALLGANGLQVRGPDAVTANLTIKDGAVTVDNVDIGNPDGVDDNGVFSGGVTLDNATLSVASLTMGGITATYDSLARLDIINGSSLVTTSINLNRGLPTGITVDGIGSSIQSNSIVVGGGNAFNRGNVNILNGAVGALGNFISVSQGESSLTVSGAGSILGLNQYDIRGYSATGGVNNLTVDGGATLNTNVTNVGTTGNAAALIAAIDGAGSSWTNSGNLNFGTLGLAGTSGQVTVTDQAQVSITGVSNLNNSSSIDVAGAGSKWTSSGAINLNGDVTEGVASISATDGGEIDASGQSIAALAHSEIIVDGGTIKAAAVNLAGGTLSGTGNIVGNVNNGSGGFVGTVSPGSSPGTLAIVGDYSQASDSFLLMDIAGTIAGDQYDVLTVSGTATLGGTLEVVLDGFGPGFGDSFDLLIADIILGTFDNVLLPTLADGLSWQSDYIIDGSGIDIFRASVVPIPPSVLLMMSSLLCLFPFRSRFVRRDS